MDDPYWEIFSSEPTDIDNSTPEHGKDTYVDGFDFVRCARCRKLDRPCQICKDKLLRRRQKLMEKNAGQQQRWPRISRLERVCSAEGQLEVVSADMGVLIQRHLTKVRVSVQGSLPGEDWDKGECWNLQHYLGLRDSFHGLTGSLASGFNDLDPVWEEKAYSAEDSDSENHVDSDYESKWDAAYDPDPGDTDDFLPHASSSPCRSFSHAIWMTGQRPSHMVLLPESRDPQVVYYLYDAAYSGSTAHAIGLWGNRVQPPMYTRVGNWMREKGTQIWEGMAGSRRLADTVF